MHEYLPITIVSSCFILTTLISAVEAYRSTQEAPSGPSGSATPPLRYTYGSSDSPNSYQPAESAAAAVGAAQGSTRKILQPSFIAERQQQRGSGGLQPPQHSIRQPRGSMGDQTRRTFYRLLTIALLSRCIFLPFEAYIYYNGIGYHQELICLQTPACIMARSLPDLAFASAFSLLVFFYAQLAGTASAGGPRGLSLVLSRRGLFATGNIVVYSIYFSLLGLTFFDVIPLLLFQMINWALLFILYGSLLFVLTYFGPVLVSLLGPSLTKPASRTLAIRLISMCVVCTLVFLSRMLCFGLAMIKTDGRFTHGLVPYWILPPPIANDVITSEYLDEDVLLRDLFGYTLLELLPSLAVLLMMHPSSSAASSGGAAAGDGMMTSNPASTSSDSGRSGQEARPLLQQFTPQQAGGTGSMRRVASGGASSRRGVSTTGNGAGVSGATSSPIRTSVSAGGS